MIIEALAVGAIVDTFYKVNKSIKLDEQAMKKYGKAFEKTQIALEKVKRKEEYTEKRLLNVANKKRTIINHTLPQFLDVYSKIQSLQRKEKDTKNILQLNDLMKSNQIASVPIATIQGFTDTQLICGIMKKGFTGMMIKESEQKVSAAKNTMYYANVLESQTESILSIYDAIIARADVIADLLLKMNILFLRSIEQTNLVINQKGVDLEKYNEVEIGTLMTCVNIAFALIELIDIPVVNEQGMLVEEAVALIEKGKQSLEKMQSIM